MEEKRNFYRKFLFIFLIIAFLWVFVRPTAIRMYYFNQAEKTHDYLLKTKINIEGVLYSSNATYKNCFRSLGMQPDQGEIFK